MRTVSISDLQARLSSFLDVVRDGDEVLVTDRGRPVARLVPVRADEHEEGRREAFVRSGRLQAPSASHPADFWSRARPLDAEGRSLAALLAERSDGR